MDRAEGRVGEVAVAGAVREPAAPGHRRGLRPLRTRRLLSRRPGEPVTRDAANTSVTGQW
ncbi:predicted protein [Streptomyces albidoflavus]|nr:predicted protein [Streptomyces albidoflavus]